MATFFGELFELPSSMVVSTTVTAFVVISPTLDFESVYSNKIIFGEGKDAFTHYEAFRNLLEIKYSITLVRNVWEIIQKL